MDKFCKLVSSVFYIGYLPVAPGSLGSFAALFLYFFVKDNPLLMGAAIVICLFLGFLTAGRAEELFGGKDASEIIIDEFTGMLVALYLLPVTMGYIVSAFLLFRFFDILKPKPINMLEKLEGSLGVMSDDLLAGVYANLILQASRLIF
ncbi:MAG: phosphatidylglycerophosphatase A [Candidatus Omnitrophica bacterium]|nr:phosphatidylglycerophosphatase A [Candidatus Omnitrophota bacterium]MBU4457837.1 phosphatidylglycerophosphatase A [Candidatus Omnitrophota bacterium]